MSYSQEKYLFIKAIYPIFRYTPEPEDTSEIVCVLNCVIYHAKNSNHEKKRGEINDMSEGKTIQYSF